MKKEENSSCQAVTFPINLSRTTNVNRIIIIPYGYPYNYDITEARPGDIICFKDGRESVIEGICVSTIASPMFNVLCRMIYGLPAADIVRQWRGKYGNDIQYEHALIITYNARFR